MKKLITLIAAGVIGYALSYVIARAILGHREEQSFTVRFLKLSITIHTKIEELK